MIVIDLYQRLVRIKNTNEKLSSIFYPRNGGHVLFIPIFIYGLIMMLPFMYKEVFR